MPVHDIYRFVYCINGCFQVTNIFLEFEFMDWLVVFESLVSLRTFCKNATKRLWYSLHWSINLIFMFWNLKMILQFVISGNSIKNKLKCHESEIVWTKRLVSFYTYGTIICWLHKLNSWISKYQRRRLQTIWYNTLRFLTYCTPYSIWTGILLMLIIVNNALWFISDVPKWHFSIFYPDTRTLRVVT